MYCDRQWQWSIYDSDINTFMNAGANRVLIKPMDVSDFHSAMASIAISGMA